ncbi:hypothetical protein [Streptomyces sp. NPDC014995]|uniref:hypothetical protein n=1 Tax=Streptomyces sp. NPDC014995 TaxID=3364936 RepID=UPI0036F80966
MSASIFWHGGSRYCGSRQVASADLDVDPEAGKRLIASAAGRQPSGSLGVDDFLVALHQLPVGAAAL